MTNKTIKYEQPTQEELDAFLGKGNNNGLSKSIINLEVVVGEVDRDYYGMLDIAKSILLFKLGGNYEQEFNEFIKKDKVELSLFKKALKEEENKYIKIRQLKSEIASLKKEPNKIKQDIKRINKSITVYGSKDDILDAMKEKRQALIDLDNKFDNSIIKSKQVELKTLEDAMDHNYFEKDSFIKDENIYYRFFDYSIDSYEQVLANLAKLNGLDSSFDVLSNSDNANSFKNYLINNGWINLEEVIKPINDLSENCDTEVF